MGDAYSGDGLYAWEREEGWWAEFKDRGPNVGVRPALWEEVEMDEDGEDEEE